MIDGQTSPEQVAAANEFNARREQDAKDWNSQSQTHGGSLTPGASPIVTMPNGRAGLNNEVLQDAANSWKAPEAADAVTPDNVIDIASHPNFHRVESESVDRPEGAQSVEAAVAPETARDFAAEQDAVFKALEINGRLSSDSSSILELSDAVRALNPDSATYQQLNSRMLDRLISSELHVTDAERAGELLNLSLQMLEHPDNSPEIVSRLDNAILTIFSQDAAKFDLAQLQRFSSIAKDRHRDDERYFKAFDAQAAKLVNEGMASSSGESASPEQPAVVTSQASESAADATQQATPAARPVTPLRTAYEIAAEKTGGPIKTVAESESDSEEAEAPKDATEADEQPAAKEATEQLQAEIDAELDKRRELTLEIQSAWRDLPPGAQNSLALSRLPKTAGFLDLAAFTAQLEQRMDNSHLQANSEFAGLNGEGLEVTLARSKRINQEFDKLLLNIERARLDSPEVKTGVAEADKIRTKHAENLEKMQAKLSKHLAGKPWLRDLVKLDPHVQKNPYFSKYGQNELGFK